MRILFAVTLVLLLLFAVPSPSRAAVKDHAIVKIGLALVNPATYLEYIGKAVTLAEAGMDVVHAGTTGADKVASMGDAGLEKLHDLLVPPPAATPAATRLKKAKKAKAHKP